MGDAMKVGMVGCDRIGHGRAWAEMLAQDEQAFIGMRVAKVWDEDRDLAKELAERIGAVAVDDLREVGEGVEGILITELFPDRYLDLARPFLEDGRRVFFNRPFAGSVADAREIVRVAREHGAKIYSASALYHTPAGEAARARLSEIAPVKLFTMTGPTDHIYFYLPHAIAATVSVLGPGIERVQAVKLVPREDEPTLSDGAVIVYVEYASGARGVMEMMGPGVDSYAFLLKMFGAKGEAEEVRFEVSYVPMLQTMREFFATGEEPVAAETLVEMTAVFYGAIESAKEGGKMVEVG
jgi:predicted dehydrogenase